MKFSSATDDAAGKSAKLSSVLEGLATGSKDTAKNFDDTTKHITTLSDKAPAAVKGFEDIEKGVKTLSTSTPPTAAAFGDLAKAVTVLSTDAPVVKTGLDGFATAIEKFKPEQLEALKTGLAGFAPDPAKINDAATATNNLAAAVERLNAATSVGSPQGPGLYDKSEQRHTVAENPATPGHRESPL